MTGDVVYVAKFKAIPKTTPEPEPEPEPAPEPEPVTPADEEKAPVKVSGDKVAPKTGDEAPAFPAALGVAAAAALIAAFGAKARKIEA